MNDILLVDDEPAVADVVEFALASAGFRVSTVGSIADATAAFAAKAPELVILDLGLPDGDGMDWCRQLRARSSVPILILTCRDDEIDRVVGLESGADDYVGKPFSPRELVARVRTILRRSQTASDAPSVLSAGRIRLDPEPHAAWLGDAAVALTPTEFAILEALLRTPGKVFTRADLVDIAYRDAVVSERTVDSHIKGIRRQFARTEANADPIETVFGVGYRVRAVS